MILPISDQRGGILSADYGNARQNLGAGGIHIDPAFAARSRVRAVRRDLGKFIGGHFALDVEVKQAGEARSCGPRAGRPTSTPRSPLKASAREDLICAGIAKLLLKKRLDLIPRPAQIGPARAQVRL